MPRRYVPKGIKSGRPKKPRDKGGRPSKYNPLTTDTIAKSLAQLGHNDTEIAQKLGISRSHFYDWQHTFPSFSDAIRAGRSQNLTGLSYKALTKALEGGVRTKSRNIKVKDAQGNLRETREEIEHIEVLPCKDTALKHLAATDPAYKGIQDKVDVPVWVAQLQQNITRGADQARKDSDTETIIEADLPD
jgi:hypothetical protein